MKQYEAVIETLKRLGGCATFGQLNQEVFKIEDLHMEYQDSICIHTSYCARPQGNLSHPSGIMGFGGI